MVTIVFQKIYKISNYVLVIITLKNNKIDT